ncbi:hypothetical protein H4R99_002844 [Coemansia sp. RSA 1722]|nr:hypothetical protein LPJ57_003390 [Coemansia sp. RSA 486]KAJ2228460.1 hypothetical protein IWW45_006592 [Coemansia sp. RSA 485]KAJ2601939.1 hypothetical protein H4R99_002844 [Coemansia sp. RSA 1722]
MAVVYVVLALALVPLVWKKMRRTPSVRGRGVVIVGASSGIGRSLALEYARRGANLLLCARRNDQLRAVAAECRALSSSQVAVVAGDITERDTQLALRDTAQTSLSTVDYLVLNAGVISVRPVYDIWLADAGRTTADTMDQAMQRVMAVNINAPALISGLFLPLLAASRGCVVVVGSVAALVAAPTRSLYSASKHAVEGYFAAFRMEVKHLGISVTMVHPGTVDTDLRKSAVDAPMGGVCAGSTRGKMSAQTCAREIVRAAALRQRLLVTPWPYWIAVVLHWVAPALVDRMAMKKYGL